MNYKKIVTGARVGLTILYLEMIFMEILVMAIFFKLTMLVKAEVKELTSVRCVEKI